MNALMRRQVAATAVWLLIVGTLAVSLSASSAVNQSNPSGLSGESTIRVLIVADLLQVTPSQIGNAKAGIVTSWNDSGRE